MNWNSLPLPLRFPPVCAGGHAYLVLKFAVKIRDTFKPAHAGYIGYVEIRVALAAAWHGPCGCRAGNC